LNISFSRSIAGLDLTYLPLADFSDGTLVLTGTNGLYFLEFRNNNLRRRQFFVWPDIAMYFKRAISAGGLYLEFKGRELVLGPDRYLVDLTQEPPSALLSGWSCALQDSGFLVTQVRLPSGIRIPGSILETEQGLYVYDGEADEVVLYRDGNPISRSQKLGLCAEDDLSPTGLGHNHNPEYVRNLWLLKLSDGLVAGVSQQDGEVFVFSPDLTSLTRFGSISDGKRVWEPDSHGSTLAAVYLVGGPSQAALVLWRFADHQVVRGKAEYAVGAKRYPCPLWPLVVLSSEQDCFIIDYPDAVYPFSIRWMRGSANE